MAGHDAAGPAAGYFYQPEKALLRLAKAPRFALVGVETGDDVVEVRYGDVTASEQLKNATQGQGNPFADRSEGLWKTLSIWVAAYAVEPERVGNSRLILSTNRAVPTSCLARTLANAKNAEGVKAAIQLLRNTGSAPSDTIKKFAESIAKSTDDDLAHIVERIRIDDGTGMTNSVRGDTIEHLQLPSNVDGSQVYDSLLGWLIRMLKGLWDSGEAGWISGEAFANPKQAIIEECRRTSFSARAARAIRFSPAEQDSKRDELFVRQLQLIEVDDDETIDAITEMIRESKEIMRLSRLGVITQKEFEDRDERLHTRWNRIFKRHGRSLPQEKERDLGYAVFDETTDHNEPLGSLVPIERYMTSGALHRLANNADYEFFIGWHPRFKDLLVPVEEESVL